MSITYATWNPSDKGTNITLSNGNLTVAKGNAGWESVRATIGVSSGKWYWEVTANTYVSGAVPWGFGVEIGRAHV